jgi:predicted hydrocarbon binding protein
MIAMNDRTKDSLIFVVSEIKKICLKRSYAEAAVKCSLLLFDIERMNNIASKKFSEIETEIINLIDELKFIIQTEIRFVLFPLPDIKKEAYEIGKKYMKNFLEWVKPEDSPEKLIGILEDENYKLEEIKIILEKTAK